MGEGFTVSFPLLKLCEYISMIHMMHYVIQQRLVHSMSRYYGAQSLTQTHGLSGGVPDATGIGE